MGIAMKSCEFPCKSSEFRLGLENALASLVRRRWPINTIDHVRAEWGLTEGRARGVVYAHASLATFNEIIRHRRGGLRLLIDLVGGITGETLADIIKSEMEATRHEMDKIRAETLALADLERTVRDLPLGSLAGRHHQRDLHTSDDHPPCSGDAGAVLSRPRDLEA